MIVKHSRGEYPIRFESLGDAIAQLPENTYIITDENVDAAWGHEFKSIPKLVFQAGESTKRMDEVERGLEWLAASGASRSCTIAAVGGGVIGDLAGFIAATYMRGVRVWQIPTSLLAQVDSSVGGKVGVDLRGGKNLAGAFHPPVEVSISHETLATLPAREIVNGMAEVWKYGYIGNLPLLDQLRRRPSTTDGPPAAEIVQQCVDQKRLIVESDEFETLGLRATLNFGHTIGHAIERVCNYETFLHGEAIAMGMVAEARWGEKIGVTKPGTANEICADLARQGLPTEISRELKTSALIDAMFADKKRETSQHLAASLILEIGTCKLFTDLDPGVLAGILLDL